MKFFLTVVILAFTRAMVEAQFYGVGPFHNVFHAADSEAAAAAHHDAQGAFAEEATAGLLDARHNEQHDMAHDLANVYGLHEHDEEHHGLNDGLRQEYAAHAARGANAVHDDVQHHQHSALAAANTGYFGYGYGYGYAPYAAYRHGLYPTVGRAFYGHAFAPLVRHGLYGHL